jgi:serine/threonine protein kinase
MDKGTSENMVPEDFTDEKYDTKADIYSLGVIFQELFALEMIE